MADAGSRIVGPVALGNAAVTVYTVPGATKAHVRTITVANESAALHQVTLSFGADGAGKRLFHQADVSAHGLLQWDGFHTLAAGEVVQAYADTAAVLTLTASAVLET